LFCVAVSVQREAAASGDEMVVGAVKEVLAGGCARFARE
jgi:hypothetical protein